MATTFTQGLARIFRPAEMQQAQALLQIGQIQPIERFLEQAPKGTAQLSKLQRIAGKMVPDLLKLTPSQRDARQTGQTIGLASQAAFGAGGVTGAEQASLANLSAGLINTRRQQAGFQQAPPPTFGAAQGPFQAGLTAGLARPVFPQASAVAPIPQLQGSPVSQGQFAQAFQGFSDPSRRAIISQGNMEKLRRRVKKGLKPVKLPALDPNLKARRPITDTQMADIMNKAKNKLPFIIPSDFDDPTAGSALGRTVNPEGKAFLGINALINKNIFGHDPSTGRLVILDQDKLDRKIAKGRISQFDVDRFELLRLRNKDADPSATSIGKFRARLTSATPPPGERSPKGFLTTKELSDKGLITKTASGRWTVATGKKENLFRRAGRGRIQPSFISRLV